MNKAISRALWGAFFVGGLTVLGAGAAHAADTSGEDGTASGDQAGILADLPVNISGNAVSILGDSESSGATATPSESAPAAGSSNTTGEDGTVGGNQVVADIVAPIVASGNAISILGDSSTEGTNTTAPAAEGTSDSADSDTTGASTTGEDALAGGNQVMPDADLPIVIGGNSISLIGDSTAEGTNTTAPAADNDGTDATTTGEDGIAGGNQVVPEVNAPIGIIGNDISVIRDDVLDDGLLEGSLFDDGLLDLDIIGDRTGPIIGDGLLPVPG